ncbi:MAG TPA: glycoside hydrolase family 30 protein [Chitinophagaceae bacterium]|nr:glycoside hydrolase family 30 protein [Chitinophagaceae bacterium]
MKSKIILCLINLILIAMVAASQNTSWTVQIFETSAAGKKLTPVNQAAPFASALNITINTEERYQKITGFGGSFTEASAYLLNKLSKANRDKILKAYFSEEGANYTLTRTHINSCDFSLSNYAYANVAGDKNLEHFSIDEDRNDLIPMIKGAQRFSKEGFKIIASPWTAPPWMKDNNDWRGGKLLPEYRETWALYFSKYIKAYKNEGIDIWAVTVENEPLGNDKNWESMHFTPEEMTAFVRDYLGPHFEKTGLSHIPILGYDQNRGNELEKWARTMFEDKEAANYFGGTAVHWYASTYDYFPASLQFTHQLAPDKYLINTEACIDADVPHWNDDNWYWSKEATDWGWDWASEKDKYLHPKYVPVFRYAGDIIGCLNNYVDGWIDWNMVLNRQGGPNWFKNWCTAPVIVDEEKDEVYFTPLYYTMAHFSKFIRPGAVRIGFENPDKELMVTAAQNPDGSLIVILFNATGKTKPVKIQLNNNELNTSISAKAIQTAVIRF